MTSLYYYPFDNQNTAVSAFNNVGNMRADTEDNTLQTISNGNFMNYMLSNYKETASPSSYVNFATEQPAITFSGIAHGNGLGGNVVDVDSTLMIHKKNDRPLEKLQLNQRPFITVPYLGKGGFDPNLESQLQQGEIASDKKSVSTIMEKSFMSYSLYPSDSQMTERVNNPAFNVEEFALDGWIRGGVASREMKEEPYKSK